jgi:hypothetical protein
LASAASTKHYLVASRLEVMFSNAMPVGFRKPHLWHHVLTLDVKCPTAVLGHAPLMLRVSASRALQSSTLFRFRAPMEFALRTTAVINIAIQQASDVAPMPKSDPMHQPLFVVAVALIAFAVFP